jgi:hypothetical protein
MRFFEGSKRGYVSVDVSRKAMNVRYRAIDDVKDSKADIATLVTFTVEDGNAGVVKA